VVFRQHLPPPVAEHTRPRELGLRNLTVGVRALAVTRTEVIRKLQGWGFVDRVAGRTAVRTAVTPEVRWLHER
jgi:hypothetical protein